MVERRRPRAPGTRAPPACLASTNALATLFIPLLPVDVKAGGQHIALGYRPYRIKRRVVTREADIVELQLHIGVPVPVQAGGPAMRLVSRAPGGCLRKVSAVMATSRRSVVWGKSVVVVCML